MPDSRFMCQEARSPTLVGPRSRRPSGVARRRAREARSVPARERTTTGQRVVALDEEVVAWRCQRLEEAGYDVTAAIELAEAAYVDLHLAVELVELGCPASTAVRILL